MRKINRGYSKYFFIIKEEIFYLGGLKKQSSSFDTFLFPLQD